MKKTKHYILIGILFFYSCTTKIKEDAREKWKNEIVETELAFAELAEKESIPLAFLTYAAEDAAIMRNDSLIIGIESLKKHFQIPKSKANKASLTWKPDFVDVALSGDLGYTYGKFTYTKIDSIGNEIVSTGIFHTVWKRQADGKWRFVWD